MKGNLANFIDNASKVNESIEDINDRIIVLEASNTHDTQENRIGELEEAMETLTSTFSYLKTKKEKTFVGKEQKFIYIPKVPKPKPPNVLNIDKPVGTSSWIPKVPNGTSHVLKEIIDLDASSFGNT